MVLKDILKESMDYYLQTEKKIIARLGRLPKGSVKKRKIGGKNYYYLQVRRGPKVVHKYLGKDEPEEIKEKINERMKLIKELKKTKEMIKILNRTKGRKKQK
ncbi:MAG: hypothetical protein WC903_05995 [Candidatus Margulisiibacteriota bacterium]